MLVMEHIGTNKVKLNVIKCWGKASRQIENIWWSAMWGYPWKISPQEKSYGFKSVNKGAFPVTHMLKHKTQVSSDHITEHSGSRRQQFDTRVMLG